MKTMVTILAALALAGCAAEPSREEFVHAYYGPQPANAEATVRAYYQATLKDPESAIYRSFTKPTMAWFKPVLSGAKFGWRLCVTYNAKNSYGGYTGYTTDAFLIRDDRVVFYIEGGMWRGRPACQDW